MDQVTTPTMSLEQFKIVRRLLESQTGIDLGAHKRAMIENRLFSRLKATQCQNFEQYLTMLIANAAGQEIEYFVDRLTTHETRFFREEHQFQQLKDLLQSETNKGVTRAWSAACSTGEEAYALAMTLDDLLGQSNWSLLGSDVSLMAIEEARQCQYPLDSANKIPPEYRKRYCLKGVGSFEGHFTLCKDIRRFCRFNQRNLLQMPKTSPERFDIIFLRNILIYFSPTKQRQIIDNVLFHLEPGGLLFLGHSENLLKEHSKVRMLHNCIYRKVGE